MTWIFSGWLVCGGILGAIHALGIKKGTHLDGFAGAVLGLLRIFAVGIGFMTSALLGGIIPMTIGWGATFFLTVAIVMRTNLRPQKQEVAS